MKQFLIFFLLLSFLLSGCGNDSSIRKELYDDSLKYYNLLNERIIAIETYSEEDKKNLKSYSDKYDGMLKDLNKEERALFAEVGSMYMSLDIISETYLILESKDMKETVDDFVKSKLKAAKMLGLE
ncbi:hypothetical protein [Brevibacillus sp. SIMBA_040]|uniref:hypothetical protein n=1 Tax=unclassified Brevibacillus TaxID=2684853 RepID=UPI00397CCE87